MQITRYPLPPLFLTEIIEKAKADHTHVCDDWCLEDDGGEYCGAACCRRSKADNEQLLDVPEIVKIEAGHGRHVHDSPDDPEGCQWRETYDKATGRYVRVPNTTGIKCMRDCDDSDWVVELRYSRRGWHAIYGVKRHGDVQHVSLWAD